jgi:hypothetical protein
MRQLWTVYEQGIQYRDEPRNWAEWWTAWRRVAGGLDRAQQLRILRDVEDPLARAGQRGARTDRAGDHDHLIRLVAALERLPPERKVQIGEWLLGAARKPADVPQRWWGLGRLGARVPFHGSIHDVVSPEVAGAWLEQVLALDWQAVAPAAFAATQLARLSGDRERDLPPGLRERAIERLRKEKAPQKWIAMLETVTDLDSADQSLAFGESLPPGLRLVG